MKNIEPVNPTSSDNLASEIKDFWTRNVNGERIMGTTISAHERGEEAYFQEIQQQRYRSHRHLLPWMREMRPGSSVLEIGCGIGLDAFQMTKLGLNVTGIDLTEVAIETAKRRFSENGL